MKLENHVIYNKDHVNYDSIILGYKGYSIDAEPINMTEYPSGVGYHIKKPKKGVYGEFSKIEEEMKELEDALNQNAKIMALHELSDMLGAMKGFLEKYYPDFTIDDLEKMSDITKRAFINGDRT